MSEILTVGQVHFKENGIVGIASLLSNFPEQYQRNIISRIASVYHASYAQLYPEEKRKIDTLKYSCVPLADIHSEYRQLETEIKGGETVLNSCVPGHYTTFPKSGYRFKIFDDEEKVAFEMWINSLRERFNDLDTKLKNQRKSPIV